MGLGVLRWLLSPLVMTLSISLSLMIIGTHMMTWTIVIQMGKTSPLMRMSITMKCASMIILTPLTCIMNMIMGMRASKRPLKLDKNKFLVSIDRLSGKKFS